MHAKTTKTPAIAIAAAIPLLLLLARSGDAQSAIDEIEVLASSPLGESDTQELSGNYQALSGNELKRQVALDASELINRNLGSVSVNEAQSNPLQPDIQYRGFVASPLLGLPQGLAVYQNGVRINEPFGDTVNWALLPVAAVDSLTLVPGADPVFGLNALGGALAVRTKTGFGHPGTRGRVYGGSFSRVGSQAETGGTFGDSLAYFATASYLDDRGWRDFSATRARQGFASLAWQDERMTIDSRLTLVDTDLTGNGAVPAGLMTIDRNAVFTHPDNTQNELAMFDVGLKREVSTSLSMAANAYQRSSDISTLNGDGTDFEECQDARGFICGDDELLFDLDGQAIPLGADIDSATVNRTTTAQDSAGATLQFESDVRPGGQLHRLMAGLAYDRSEIGFSSSTELGSLDASRGAVPGGIVVSSSLTSLATRTANSSLFFSGEVTLGERFRAGISGRYNRTRVRLDDRIGTALDGSHEFQRFNPAANLLYHHSGTQVYLRYSEASRVPSPVELTCADEDAPCRLPNAFLSDPPLNMVVARTVEAGVRFRKERFSLHAGLFHTLSQDDILFISAGAFTNEGFFDNVGDTRRRGIEINVAGRYGESADWYLNYTWLDATFEDTFSMSSPNNPAAIAGEIRVRKGDRLPLIPQHILKAGLSWLVAERLEFGVDVQAVSDSYLRGDEGNDVNQLDGYAIANAFGHFELSDRIRFFAKATNLFNTDYETFGLFGEADEVLGDEFDDTRFLSPGAPRAAWIGVEVSL